MYTKTIKKKSYTLPATVDEEVKYRKDIGQYGKHPCPMNCLFVWPTVVGDVYQMGSISTWLEPIPNTSYLLRVFSVDTQPGNVYAAIDPLWQGGRRDFSKNQKVVLGIADIQKCEEHIQLFVEGFGLKIGDGQSLKKFVPLCRPNGTTLNNKVLNWSRLTHARSGYTKGIAILDTKEAKEAYTALDKETRKARVLWTQNNKELKVKDLQQQADDQGMTIEELIQNKLTKKDIKLSSERTLMLLEFSSVFSKTRMEIERFEASLANVDSPMTVKDCRALRNVLTATKAALYRIQNHTTTKP